MLVRTVSDTFNHRGHNGLAQASRSSREVSQWSVESAQRCKRDESSSSVPMCSMPLEVRKRRKRARVEAKCGISLSLSQNKAAYVMLYVEGAGCGVNAAKCIPKNKRTWAELETLKKRKHAQVAQMTCTEGNDKTPS
jgi:hypothetical protein